MLSTRVRTQPITNSLLGSHPPATPSESELILAVGTMAETAPPSTHADPNVLTLWSQLHWYASAEVVAMDVMQLVFCLPAEIPGASEIFNWDYLSIVALVFF